MPIVTDLRFMALQKRTSKCCQSSLEYWGNLLSLSDMFLFISPEVPPVREIGRFLCLLISGQRQRPEWLQLLAEPLLKPYNNNQGKDDTSKMHAAAHWDEAKKGTVFAAVAFPSTKVCRAMAIGQ
eukprot:1961344-Pleurochrysis_carterae.AAC.2